MSICVHWYSQELIQSAQKIPKKIKMCQNKNNMNLISYHFEILNVFV